jgi:hypothetical protein
MGLKMGARRANCKNIPLQVAILRRGPSGPGSGDISRVRAVV